MLVSVGTFARWLVRFAVPNFAFLFGTYFALYFIIKYLQFPISPSWLIAVAVLLNPSTVGGIAVLLLLLKWETEATRFCRLPLSQSSSVSQAITVAKANECLIDRLEAVLAKWSPLKAGVYLAFAIHAQLVVQRMRVHQANTTDSVDSDLAHKRIAEFLAFHGQTCRFVVSLLGHPRETDSSIKELEHCIDSFPLKTQTNRLQKAVLETFRDGPGFISTLNFLLRLALCLVQPETKREEIIRVFENVVGEPRKVGWLANRFFEYALRCRIIGVDAKSIRIRLKKHLDSFLAKSDEDGANLLTVKWETRDSLRNELPALKLPIQS